jgi:hypothetical protein
VARHHAELIGAHRRRRVEQRGLVAGVLGFAVAHHRRQHLDVCARHVTRTQRIAGGFVFTRQARHTHELRRGEAGDRCPVREPRPRVQGAVERPIRPRVPLAHRPHELRLEPLGDLEELDQLVGTCRARPLVPVLGVEVFDGEADLLDRVITEHTFDNTQGVRQLQQRVVGEFEGT